MESCLGVKKIFDSVVLVTLFKKIRYVLRYERLRVSFSSESEEYCVMETPCCYRIFSGRENNSHVHERPRLDSLSFIRLQ